MSLIRGSNLDSNGLVNTCEQDQEQGPGSHSRILAIQVQQTMSIS
jgi:hypothetical protein